MSSAWIHSFFHTNPASSHHYAPLQRRLFKLTLPRMRKRWCASHYDAPVTTPNVQAQYASNEEDMVVIYETPEVHFTPELQKYETVLTKMVNNKMLIFHHLSSANQSQYILECTFKPMLRLWKNVANLPFSTDSL